MRPTRSSEPAAAPGRRAPRRRAGLIALALAGALLGASDDESSQRGAMQEIYEGLRALLPLSLSEDGLSDPDRADEIRAHFQRVAEAAGAVSEHAGGRDEGTRFLGRALEIEARQAGQLFEVGAVMAARIGVLRMTEYCVACHSRLPAPDSRVAAGFLSNVAFETLGPAERARVQLATRQFDASLTTLEDLLASADPTPVELLEQLTSYMIVALRVKRDYERPVPILERLAARPDIWLHLRLDIRQWIESLQALDVRGRTSSRLDDAVEILNAGRALIRFPSDRQALVHYVSAAAILERFLETDSGDARARARAYYLLGLVESRIGTTFLIALPDFYLEASIRLDPTGPYALPAYAMLEETTVCEFSIECDARVGDLPPDVEAYLTDLRELLPGQEPRQVADSPL